MTGFPAAQYIRMSTDHQRFSLTNQRAAIEGYARDHGYEVIETYEDPGRSGLTFKGRPGLQRLIADVCSGNVAFRTILVLDVSRWGRFQDADQAAYYEYMCRQAGVAVLYCGETFANDASPLASIMKQMKRVMAAEYSRELSARISRAQRQQARLGYKQGGIRKLATRRQVIDEHGNAKALLDRGEGKGLKTDRIVMVRGPAREVTLVRRIFEMYTVQQMRLGQIAKQLDRERRRQVNGNRWSAPAIRHLLQDEIYLGEYVFGKNYNNLGNKVPCPVDRWSRAAVMEPVVDKELFTATKVQLQQRTRRGFWPDDDMIDGLKRLFKQEGCLSKSLIDECDYLPSACAIAKRYGTLVEAYRLVGYIRPPRWAKPDGSRYADNDMLDALRRIFVENGEISGDLIDGDPESPSLKHYIVRFGGLYKAYALADLDVSPQSQRILAARRGRESGKIGRSSRPTRRYRNPDGSKITNDQMLAELAALFKQHGYLSMSLIDGTPGMRSSTNYGQRFGGLKAAYARVGFRGPRKGTPRGQPSPRTRV